MTACGRYAFDGRADGTSADARLDASLDAPPVTCAFTRPLTVTASSEALVGDYSVRMTLDHASLVAAGKSTAAGDDVHVLYAGHEIDRVLDPGSSWATGTTGLWFRLQSPIGANTSDSGYTLCYGAPITAPPAADPDRVFLLWDDFSAATVDQTKWHIESSGGVSVSAFVGQLRIAGTTTAMNEYDPLGIASRLDYAADLRVDCTFSVVMQSALAQINWKALPGAIDNTGEAVVEINSETDPDKRVQYWNGAWTDLADSSLDTLTFAGAKLTETVTADGQVDYYENGIHQAVRNGVTSGPFRIVFQYSPDVNGGGETYDVRFDDVVVRRHVASDTSISVIAGAEM